MDLAWHDGRIHVLDAGKLVIWVLPRFGAARQTIPVAGLRPRSLFFGCDGTLHVTDPWERTVRSRSPRGVWRLRRTGHRVFHGAGDRRGIGLVGPRDGRHRLIWLVGCDGDTVRCGQPHRLDHPHPSATHNANYTQIAVGDSLVVVAHMALGHLRIHQRDGRHHGDLQLRGAAPRTVRRWYLRNQGRQVAGPVAVTRDSLLADLAAAARPGTFPVPVYVNDLAIHGGRILVLVGGTLQVYTPAGTLQAAWPLDGRHAGERVVVHQIAVTDDGTLLGLDAVHYQKIYDFGPLPWAGARGPSP